MYLMIFKEAIQAYEDAKVELANKLPCVKRMVTSLNFVDDAAESTTKKMMDHASYPESLSIWEFEDENGLNDFLSASDHVDMVKKDWIRHMKRRYVGNMVMENAITVSK